MERLELLWCGGQINGLYACGGQINGVYACGGQINGVYDCVEILMLI